MRKSQWIAAAAAFLLVLVTYWGCPVRPPEFDEGFNRGPVSATGVQSLIREAHTELTPAQKATLATLEERLESQEEDSARVDLLQQLAGEWYKAGKPSISGAYAARIAEIENSEQAWSITATTFSLCLKQEGIDDKTRQFCASQAEQAYQAAISLNPNNPETRINLAVTYTDNPPPDNPMKGILMLREIEQQYPDNPKVYITLAQLALKTNQIERAAERLATADRLDPDNPDVVCPLAKVYENLGRAGEADIYARKCAALLQ
ncbi:tetratricopeptide (TPR) repeat protein [Lewinella aquimaris]|uniref:Tetratricopeptide (TPR) repeat protein n=1 Tax=Neolewinella aquimaris TaxID=1835722 RepID=A0A840DYW1_9BACT|nr:tetratricopeptide repeat protein [Neolewinella aquimaris]MBB4078454.1 tetratricopeptide (TPR) repeat protein [Neolewinella aquimaris]